MITTETRGAWRELEARLRPYVARRVSAADVDDVLQEVFVRLHRDLHDLRDGERFGGWVYRVAAHAIADSARARMRHPIAPAASERQPSEPEEADQQQAEALVSDMVECVALFVARLPSPYREAVTLTALEGMKQQEAADMLGISLSGMKSRVQRGRDKLRAMFEECCDIALDGRARVLSCDRRGGF